LTRELQTDLDDPWAGRWRALNAESPVILSLGQIEVLRLPLPVFADMQKAFARPATRGRPTSSRVIG
jgi:hypothetical protein